MREASDHDGVVLGRGLCLVGGGYWLFQGEPRAGPAGAVLLSYLEIDSWTEAKEWLQIVLPATTALLGAAIGFYFGTRGENT